MEEAVDECLYWMELLADTPIVKLEAVEPLMKKAHGLFATGLASMKTAKRRGMTS